MRTETVITTIRVLPGDFGNAPPYIVETPIGRRIADSLDSAIILAESIGTGIAASRFPESDRKSALATYEINGGKEIPDCISISAAIEVRTTMTCP